MKSTILWALVVLNVALLASFAWRLVPDKTAVAQQAPPAAPARAGDLLVLPVEVNGATQGIVVVVDQTNGILGALSFDEASNKAGFMPPVNLRAIFDQGNIRPGTGRGR
jgi:hypothetical protein